MVKELNSLLSKILNCNAFIIPKKDFIIENDKKFFPVNNNFIFVYDREISPKILHEIKIFLERFLKKYEKTEEDLKKLKILQKELENLLRSNELFFSKKRRFERFFLFFK